MCAILGGLAAWAAVAVGLAAADTAGAITMAPLLLLAGAFEINFFLHTGVERIGRYVQVFHEEAAGWRGWETVAMDYGRRFPGSGDPLLITVFGLGAAVNFLSAFALTARRPGWLIISLVAHMIFGWRLISARRLAMVQRVVDLERFRALRAAPSAADGIQPIG